MPSTDREQLLLEYINDARLDPLVNAARFIKTYTAKLTSADPDIQGALDFYKVNGAMLLKQFAALKPAAPLAWNDKLATAARNHNKAMISADAQQHEGLSDGPLGARITKAGYQWSNIGENIFAYGKSALYEHAGFMVDWGGDASTGGMQNPPGHRNSIMSTNFREVGIGVTLENNAATKVGPQVVTQDFGTRMNGPAVFVLGVAYSDKNKDGFYSLGEGVKALKVSLDGKAVLSGTSGGYTLESAAVGAKSIVLSGGGLSGAVTVAVKLAAGNNVKLDVIDGTVLHTSVSATVSGPVTVIDGLGIKGLTLKAGAGNQTLIGTGGKDTLFGGAGADTFLFDTKLGAANIDTVSDFTMASNDRVGLDHDIFSTLKAGALAATAFFKGAAAHDSNDRVVYDGASGKLFYDADGTGAKAAVQFATLTANLKIDHTDFFVV